jgi:hypothetical protein
MRLVSAATGASSCPFLPIQNIVFQYIMAQSVFSDEQEQSLAEICEQ